MATAGRTVLFSSTTVALSMAVMVFFPMHFLQSFAYAGVATVAFAALAAIVVTPAAIMLLGDRLDALDVRRLLRRLLSRPEPAAKPVEEQFWYRSTKFVMKRAIPIGLVGVAVLAVLGAPFFGVRPGFPDDRVLPKSASAHQVGDQLRRDFSTNFETQVPVVIPDSDGLSGGEIARYAADLSRVPDVIGGLRADRHLCQRRPGGASGGGHRSGLGQHPADDRQHRPAVLRPLRAPARPAARRRRTRRPHGRVHRNWPRSTATACMRSPPGCRWCWG